MAGIVLEKMGFLLNDLERNSSGGNETSKTKMLSLLWLDSTQVEEDRVVKERLKHVRAHAAADAIFFIRIRKISLFYV